MTNSSTLTVKIGIIGDESCGKSYLLHQFADSDFRKQHASLKSSIGIDYCIRTIKINNKDIKVQLWDTAGQVRFKTMTERFFRGADAVIFIFDADDRRSYENVSNWLLKEDHYSTKDIKYLLIANIDDSKKREVSKSEIKILSKKLQIDYVELNISNDLEVTNTITKLVNTIIQ